MTIAWAVLLGDYDSVNIESLLHFDSHVDRIVAKAYSRIGLLFRGFVSRNLHLLKQSYITYIRSLL